MRRVVAPVPASIVNIFCNDMSADGAHLPGYMLYADRLLHIANKAAG